MALKFKPEVNLFLDLYLPKNELVKWWWFFWNRFILYHEWMITYEKTKKIIEVLEPLNISETIMKVLETEYETEYSLEDFERFKMIWKAEYVAIESKWIELKVYRHICKMLEEFNMSDITVSVWEMIIFSVSSDPLIIVAPYKLDAQTELFNEEKNA